MRSIPVLVLSAFVVQAYAKEEVAHYISDAKNGTFQTLANKFIDKLVNRVLNAESLHNSDLEDTILGKAGHVAVSQKASSLSGLGSFSSTRSSPVPPRWTGAAVRTPSIPSAETEEKPVWIANPFVEKKRKKEPTTKDSSYVDWPVVLKSMIKRGFKEVDGLEALAMVQDEGAVIADVRPKFKYDKFTIENAVSLPLFRMIQGNSARDKTKEAMSKFNGVDATERNPDFGKLAKELLPKDKPIIVVCERGGEISLEYEGEEYQETREWAKFFTSMMTPLMPKKGYIDFARYPNRYTTSFKAASELYNEGFDKLYFIKGGMRQWAADDLPMVGEMEFPEELEKAK